MELPIVFVIVRYSFSILIAFVCTKRLNDGLKTLRQHNDVIDLIIIDVVHEVPVEMMNVTVAGGLWKGSWSSLFFIGVDTRGGPPG